MPKPQVNMTSREIFVVSDTPSRNNPGAGWKIRLVQWIKEGKSVSVKLEVGEYWKDKETGEPRFKTKGLTLKDFSTISGKWKEIKPLFDNPPAVPAEAAAPADAPEEDGPGF